MSSDLDDWLNSLGIDPAPSTPETTAIPPAQPAPIPQQIQEEQPASTLSFSDFNTILADNGFQEPVYETAEEVTDADDGNNNEEENEGRDLDAEEDADWEERIELGELTPVEQAIGELDEDIALEAVQSVNEEDYPEHNPDGVVSVPIVHASESPQEVSDAAMEAFNVIAEQTTAAPSAPEPPIPYNSPTLLLNNATSRFSGTEWYNEIQRQRIIVAGIGGIGSNCVYQLARMNPAALFMYDDDIVEQVNMSGQLYCQNDVGKAKVDAMADMIKSYTTMRNIYAINDKFTQNSEAGDIMICGFDNMTARKTFYNSWKNHVLSKSEEERYKCLFLDGRLSINILQVLCLTGNCSYDWEEYEKNYLFSDAQAEETQCSLKQTTYLACMIGSMIVNLFTNWTANLLNPIIPYDLPFFTEYDAQNMIFKTIK